MRSLRLHQHLTYEFSHRATSRYKPLIIRLLHRTAALIDKLRFKIRSPFDQKKFICRELFYRTCVLLVHSKITFSIARNVIMIGLLTIMATLRQRRHDSFYSLCNYSPARVTIASPTMKSTNMRARSLLVDLGAPLNSFHTNTPHKAAIMGAPCPCA